MSEKEIEFQDKQGRKIVGTLITPDGKGPFPAVIVCHGFKGDRNQTHIKQIAEEISKKGIVTLRVDFTHDPGGSSLEFENMTISYEIEVLDQAVNFLKNVQEVDSTRIGLTGHSLGGLVVSWYTANHPEIKSLAPLSAVYSYPKNWERNNADWIAEIKEKGYGLVWSETHQRNFKLYKAFYEDGLAYDMDTVIENINCPVLVVQGTADKPVTMESAQHYYDRVVTKQKELKIIKDSDHNYTNPDHLNQVKTAVADWFAKTL